MRIVKASAIALALSLALGVGAASAGDMSKKHMWMHSGTHPIAAFLAALFHCSHVDAVKVSY